VGLAATPALAQGKLAFKANLDGYQEVPAVSTSGTGAFSIDVNAAESSANYELSYAGLTGAAVLFAHVHLGRPATNGGVMVFLCSNVGAPVPTPACPGPAGGTVTGTLTAADVIGPSGQGVAPGEFAEFVAALRAGAAYANVHTAPAFGGGEIRGDIK